MHVKLHVGHLPACLHACQGSPAGDAAALHGGPAALRLLAQLCLLLHRSAPALQADSKPSGIPGLAVKDVGPYYAF